MIYGTYTPPVEIREKDFSIVLSRTEEGFLYQRKTADDETQKIILTDRCNLLINPIEPVSTPKRLTSHLMIEFTTNVVIAPSGKSRVYLKFPVEVGIFVSKNSKKTECIDIFSLAQKKFALYGDITQGILCKYYSSDVYNEVPAVNPLQEGVIELRITNKLSEWVEVHRVVFNAFHMKLYYNDTLVSMRAVMTINEEDMASTGFVDKPLVEGMHKSLELYTSKRLQVLSATYLMEWGL